MELPLWVQRVVGAASLWGVRLGRVDWGGEKGKESPPSFMI